MLCLWTIEPGEPSSKINHAMKLRNRVDHIFFDLDHTLWDFDKNSGLAFERVFALFKIPLGLREFLEIYEPINLEYWRLYREDLVSKTELRRGRLGKAFKHFNLEFPLDTIDAMAHQYIEELPKDNHLFPGAIELLEYLAPFYNLHIITNGFHQVQHKKLQNSGIAHFFKTVTTSEDAGVKKPNPKIFTYALGLSGAQAGASIMIGDSYQADILGAQAMGFNTLFYNYKNQDIGKNSMQVQDLAAVNCFL